MQIPMLVVVKEGVPRPWAFAETQTQFVTITSTIPHAYSSTLAMLNSAVQTSKPSAAPVT